MTVSLPIVPCAHWSPAPACESCGVCGLDLYGGRPSFGVCLTICQRYDGPPRTADMAKRAAEIPPATKRRLVDAYAHAEASLFAHGPVPLTVYEERKARCMNCDGRVAHGNDPVGFCAPCGCGLAHRAKLSTKLHMPSIKCPRGEFGPAAGEGREHLARVGGVFAQAVDVAKGAIDVLAGGKRRRERKRITSHSGSAAEGLSP